MDTPVERAYADLVAARSRIAAAQGAAEARGNLADADDRIKPALLLPASSTDAVVFDPEFYRMTNPDVSAAGVDPWMHFQIHGWQELRDPHPAVSCRWLGGFIPPRQDVGILDQYLIDPRYWLIRPHAGIDIEGFAASGRWSGSHNPLLEAIESGSLADWVSTLQAPAEGREETLLRESMLFSARHPGLHARTDIVVQRSDFALTGPYRVFPGVGVGNAAGQLLLLTPEPGAARDDIVLLDRRAVSWTSDQMLEAESVVVIPPGICPTVAQLSQLSDAVVVPGDALTERALRLARQVLHLPSRIWSVDTSMQVRARTLITSLPAASGPLRLPRSRWPFRSQPLTVNADLTQAQLTVSSRPDPTLRDQLETGIEGLAVLAQVDRGRVRLSSDLAHVRPLLSELLEHGR